jgi:hypothetical protein
LNIQGVSVKKIPLAELQAQVRAQKTAIPAIYGKVDFDQVPERFTADPRVQTILPKAIERKYRPSLLADTDRVERARAYTMMGDNVADAYAALIRTHGFHKLVGMLVQACEKGIDSVQDAPPELERFIASMEKTPDWIDRKLSAQGARSSRAPMAILVPFMIRGAFIATFTNKYAGLPMVLTGALSHSSTEQRVKETTSFFTTATLPNALDRQGPGFRAAAMVRLMHSIVRASLLMHPERWDTSVYGVPVPQIDQLPAGTMPSTLTALKAVKAKRGFTRRERAIVELCRHQCFMLGLPGDLLPETPKDIVEMVISGAGTLREGYDDKTNGQLVRATMQAYLPPDRSLRNRVLNSVERSVSKVFFRHGFPLPAWKAKQMGVVPNPLDYARFAAFQAYAIPAMLGHIAAERIPIVNEIADYFLVQRINELLVSYGHAEFTTDPAKHKAVPKTEGQPAHGGGMHLRPAAGAA